MYDAITESLGFIENKKYNDFENDRMLIHY